MGLFSWNCPCCGHSIRHRGATVETSRWLSEAVVVFSNGDRISGTYSGYGEVGYTEITDHEGDFTLYHRTCWERAEKPEFTKPSSPAHDQGHFVGEYDPEEPKSIEDCEILKAAAKAKLEQKRLAYEKARAERRAEYVARGEEVPAWLG